MALKKLIYTSRRLDTDAETLDSILEVSRRRNRRDGVTGLLLHDEKRFIQFLEGDHDAIAHCFLRIALSDRHTGIAIGAFGDSEFRVFTGWDMRATAVTRASPSLSALWRRIMAVPCENRLGRFESILMSMPSNH